MSVRERFDAEVVVRELRDLFEKYGERLDDRMLRVSEDPEGPYGIDHDISGTRVHMNLSVEQFARVVGDLSRLDAHLWQKARGFENHWADEVASRGVQWGLEAREQAEAGWLLAHGENPWADEPKTPDREDL